MSTRLSTLIDRLVFKTKKTAGGCIEFQGCKDRDGYGKIRLADEEFAHRAAYAIFVGPIPDGLSVLHSCDNPPCILPVHLFLGTTGDNNADKTAKGRCWHPIGETHPSVKLTEQQVREIRLRRHRGETLNAIALDYGLCFQTVSDIARRKIWRHIA